MQDTDASKHKYRKRGKDDAACTKRENVVRRDVHVLKQALGADESKVEDVAERVVVIQITAGGHSIDRLPIMPIVCTWQIIIATVETHRLRKSSPYLEIIQTSARHTIRSSWL